MYFLPNDLLEKIIADIDIVSLIRLTSTSKRMREIGLDWKLCKHPIQYLNKASYTSNTYANLNSMVDDMVAEITGARGDCLSTQSKEYTTARQHQNYTLQLNRSVRHHKGRPIYSYGFTIKRRGQKAPGFQLFFDQASDNYVGMHASGPELHLPLLFLYLGYKVLFKIHGYCNVKSLRQLPPWFSRVVLSKNYNGLVIRDIVNGFVVL